MINAQIFLLPGLRSPDSLCLALTPLFDQLAKSSWSSLSWPPTSARPVWLSAVVGLLDAHVTPVMHDLLERVDGLKVRKIHACMMVLRP